MNFEETLIRRLQAKKPIYPKSQTKQIKTYFKNEFERMTDTMCNIRAIQNPDATYSIIEPIKSLTKKETYQLRINMLYPYYKRNHITTDKNFNQTVPIFMRCQKETYGIGYNEWNTDSLKIMLGAELYNNIELLKTDDSINLGKQRELCIADAEDKRLNWQYRVALRRLQYTPLGGSRTSCEQYLSNSLLGVWLASSSVYKDYMITDIWFASN